MGHLLDPACGDLRRLSHTLLLMAKVVKGAAPLHISRLFRKCERCEKIIALQ